jgi:hypothetical protein
MFGIGDCLHQRAVVRRLLEYYDVWLETCHIWQHVDLLERNDNLHLILRPTSLWMHAQNIQKERAIYSNVYRPAREIPRGTRQVRNWYLKKEIDKTGSMLGAMFLAAGLEFRDPDFSLPVRPEWRTPRVVDIVARARDSGKQLMLYRPIVLRKEWDSRLRNPDPTAYELLYTSAREGFFTVSIASLRENTEWIVGKEQPADLKLHGGQLEMWEMAALFAEADVVFCNAGMAPVLAQAVGTPSIVVYGGRESFKTSQRAGAHLAPTLGIDPVDPCDCHSHTHNCNKFIDIPPALARIREFIDAHATVRDDLRRHA